MAVRMSADAPPHRKYCHLGSRLETGSLLLGGLLGSFLRSLFSSLLGSLLLFLLNLVVIGRLKEGVPDNCGKQQIHADKKGVTSVATGHEECGHGVGGIVHIEHLRMKARPTKVHPHPCVRRKNN